MRHCPNAVGLHRLERFTRRWAFAQIAGIMLNSRKLGIANVAMTIRASATNFNKLTCVTRGGREHDRADRHAGD